MLRKVKKDKLKILREKVEENFQRERMSEITLIQTIKRGKKQLHIIKVLGERNYLVKLLSSERVVTRHINQIKYRFKELVDDNKLFLLKIIQIDFSKYTCCRINGPRKKKEAKKKINHDG